MRKNIILSMVTAMVLFCGCNISQKEDKIQTDNTKQSVQTSLDETIDVDEKDENSDISKEHNIDEGEQDTHQETQKVNPLDNLDYTLRGSCGYFADLFGEKSWFYTYGNSAEKIIAEITDDSGNIIEPIIPDETSSVSNSRIIEIARHDSQNANILKSHFKDNVLISCIYENEDSHEEVILHDFAPLDDPKYWKKTLYYPPQKIPTRNNTLMYGSILNDLRYKIYLKNYAYYGDKKTALQKADDFMEKAFPGGIYHPTNYVKYVDQWSHYHFIAPRGSRQAQYYRKLNDLAWEYTNKRVDLLNDMIAENYKSYYLGHTGCIDKWICGAIFPDATEVLIVDPEFNEGLTYWEIKEELYGSAIGNISKQIISTTPRKYNIKLSLKVSHGTNTPISYLDIHQEYILQNTQEIDNLFLKIKSKKLYGSTTNPWNLTNSGLAGYFVCFNDINGKEIGCMVVSDYTDKIILDILIGYMFQVESTNSLYIVKGSRKPFEVSYNLGKIVQEHLPSVRNRLYDVYSVKVGAFVTEATQQKRCNDCISTVEVEKLSLEKLK